MASAIPKEVLDDLTSRFLMGLTPDELDDAVRVCFQAEKAHWFYIDHLDYYSKQVAKTTGHQCLKCNIREFIRQFFLYCPSLRQHSGDIDTVYEKWREYKGEIPTHGAILLDESLEYVLLVQGFHSKASWGFPKGKCNEEEQPHDCAIREVKEETGFDTTPLIDENEYLERYINETPNRLYVVPNVPRDYAFKPTTRNEIKDCRWFLLDSLPSSKADMTKTSLGIYPTNFYMVFPFVEQMKRWVANRRGGGGGGRQSASSRGAYGSSNMGTPTVAYGWSGKSSARTRSVSHSSPTFFTGDYARQHQQQHVSTNQKGTSSAKAQQQQQKKNKKTSTVVRQKLNFDNALTEGSVSSSTVSSSQTPGTSTSVQLLFDNHQSAAIAAASTPNNNATTPSSTEDTIRNLMKSAAEKLEIKPSQTWQQFHFNWEPIFSAM